MLNICQTHKPAKHTRTHRRSIFSLAHHYREVLTTKQVAYPGPTKRRSGWMTERDTSFIMHRLGLKNPQLLRHNHGLLKRSVPARWCVWELAHLRERSNYKCDPQWRMEGVSVFDQRGETVATNSCSSKKPSSPPAEHSLWHFSQILWCSARGHKKKSHENKTTTSFWKRLVLRIKVFYNLNLDFGNSSTFTFFID